jgi:hypothetical protein
LAVFEDAEKDFLHEVLTGFVVAREVDKETQERFMVAVEEQR